MSDAKKLVDDFVADNSMDSDKYDDHVKSLIPSILDKVKDGLPDCSFESITIEDGRMLVTVDGKLLHYGYTAYQTLMVLHDIDVGNEIVDMLINDIPVELKKK